MKIIDVTIPLSNKTPVWEGDEEVSITRNALISEGADFNESKLELGVHTGTHIDAPFHVFSDGNTVDKIPMGHLIGKAQVVRIADDVERISRDVLQHANIEKGIKHLLFKTRNSLYWKDKKPRFQTDFSALDASAAEFLVSQGVKLAGIDWFSISPMDDLMTPHVILLRAGIVIVENLNLSDVKPGLYDLYCLPLKLVGTDGAPARVILIQDE